MLYSQGSTLTHWPKVDSMSQLKIQLKLSKCVNKKIKSCKKLISMSPIPACF